MDVGSKLGAGRGQQPGRGQIGANFIAARQIGQPRGNREKPEKCQGELRAMKTWELGRVWSYEEL